MLQENPFSSASVPRRDIVHWADRKEIKENIINFIESKETPWCKVLLIKGDYGSGKTHSLIYAHNYCQNHHYPSILLLNPGPSFVDLTRRIIDYIGFDEILLACNEILKKDKDKILEALQKTELSSILKLEGITIDRMLKFAFPELDANLAIMLSQAYNGRNIDLGRAWLLGKNMASTELGKLNISRSVNTDDYAVKILSDVLRIYIEKKNTLVIFIDELEDISNLSSKDAISYSKSLRRLIDENIKNCKLIVTFTEDAFENFEKGTGGFRGKTYQALVDRLSPRENLGYLTEENIKDFMNDFISRTTKESLDKIITQKAIRQIYNYLKTEGVITPRRLILYCNQLFEKAIKDGDFPISNIAKYQKMDNI